MEADPTENDRVRRLLLLHLLEHHGQQVRFEASQWATEFGMLRTFPEIEPTQIRATLRSLEMGRFIFQRTQYVVGYSEPKIVYSLTPSGHRQAVELQRVASGEPPVAEPEGAPDVDIEARPAPSG